MWEMCGLKKLIQKFRYRKMILAVADAFIVAISALLVNFLLSNWGKGLGVSDLRISMAVSVCCCGACLMLAGAYNKLWRYFNVKDYLSCVYGVVAGVTAARLLVYIIRGCAGDLCSAAWRHHCDRHLSVPVHLQADLY